MQRQQLSLSELSAAAGMTARNVRAYQTKGLIPPPARRGRRAVYTTEHLIRLQEIEQARARGASLTLIATHLARGRPLTEDEVVDWAEKPTRDDEPAPHTEIGPLLATLDIQRDPNTHAQVADLISGGVFRQEGRQVFTGRELADALTALQGQGLPLEAALGFARRAMRAAEPLTHALANTTSRGNGTEAATGAHLADLASSVVRQVILRGPVTPRP